MWKQSIFWLTTLALPGGAFSWHSHDNRAMLPVQQRYTTTFGLPQARVTVEARSVGSPVTCHFFSSSDFDGSEGGAIDEEASILPQQPPPLAARASTPSSALPGLTSEQKRLDPLLVSLTRMDDETRNAPRTTVPLWGELILDKSLIVLLPVAAFAVAGFFLSLYVAANAQDSFVDAWVEAARQQSAAAVPAADESACRGLCSNQEQDLEGLRVFMEGLRK